jgi:heat shock protein HtpX
MADRAAAFKPSPFAFFQRITLFVLTNFAVVLLLGAVLRLTGLDAQVHTATGGLNLGALLAMAAVFGFGGSFFSLLISKPMAKWSTGAQVITRPADATEAWLVETVAAQAKAVGIGMPDVAIFPSPEPNAFATGAFRNSALVAVSTGLLTRLSKREVEAVLAHEVAHVANGDMVTMALLQGVVNTFVIVFSRIAGFLVDSWLRGNRDGERSGRGIGYWIASFVAEIILGFLATLIVMAYSRRREFRADAGAAALVGTGPMKAALARLQQGHDGPADLPQSLAAFGIRGGGGWLRLLASHPPIEDRIAALEALDGGR